MEVVEGIILAAGLSSRAGAFKLGWDLGGRTVLQRCVESMAPFCRRIVVVSGFRPELIAAMLLGYGKVQTVRNPGFEKGMFSSVQVGVKAVRAERFFLTPGDCPLIQTSTYAALLGAAGEIIVPVYRGRSGHPILLGAGLREQILGRDVSGNLEGILGIRGYRRLSVEDPGVLVDIDTMGDLERARAYLET